MIFYPLRLSFLGEGQYELEVVDDEGIHQSILCTVVEQEVTFIRMDPNPFMQSLTDTRSIYAAIMAFHRAYLAQKAPPTTEIA